MPLSDDDITKLYKMKTALEVMLKSNDNMDVQHLLVQIKNCIFKQCEHDIVDDLIDIDYDRSCMVSYCTKCFSTIKN